MAPETVLWQSSGKFEQCRDSPEVIAGSRSAEVLLEQAHEKASNCESSGAATTTNVMQTKLDTDKSEEVKEMEATSKRESSQTVEL